MSITAAHIAPQGGGFEPQRANNFTVELYGVPGAGNLTLAVASSNFPSDSNEQILVHYQGEERKVAGKAKVGDKTIVLVDYVDAGIFQALAAWRKLVYDAQSGKIGFARSYKKQAAYILNAPDGTSFRTYKMNGVWPKNLNPGQLSYEASGVLKINLTLAVDTAWYVG